jgi:hypothetical protein
LAFCCFNIAKLNAASSSCFNFNSWVTDTCTWYVLDNDLSLILQRTFLSVKIIS